MLDSKIYLSSYNPQCREMSGKHKRRKFATLFYHSTLYQNYTKTKIVLLQRNNSQSERSFVPGFIYCYVTMTKPFIKFPDRIISRKMTFWFDQILLWFISSVGESHYTSFAFWKNGLYICNFLCLYFIFRIKAVFCRCQLLSNFLFVSWQGDHGKSSHH